MLAPDMKWSALAASEIFVLPSYSEGFSMAVLEALGMGRPAVITRRCNFPEVGERNCGFVIEPDARRLEGRFDRDVERPRRRDELKTFGDNGRQLIADRYTWERHRRPGQGNLRLGFGWPNPSERPGFPRTREPLDADPVRLAESTGSRCPAGGGHSTAEHLDWGQPQSRGDGNSAQCFWKRKRPAAFANMGY